MNARLWSAATELQKLTIRDLTELERVRPGAGVQILQTGMLMRGLSDHAHYDYLRRPMTSVSCDFPEDLNVAKIAFLDAQGNTVHAQDLKTGMQYVIRAEDRLDFVAPEPECEEEDDTDLEALDRDIEAQAAQDEE